MIFPNIPKASTKHIAIFVGVVVIVVAGVVFYKYLYTQQQNYIETIKTLEREKIASQSAIKTLEKSLEEEKLREKIRTVYVDKIVEVEKKVTRKQEEIKKPAANSEELNRKFKGVMECFEKNC
ncbi:hypothetical protein [Synechococcus phage BUCT-ZZ01]|nr:hypothetical protein [Synechococcus phage BUCT-ZZ01]